MSIIFKVYVLHLGNSFSYRFQISCGLISQFRGLWEQWHMNLIVMLESWYMYFGSGICRYQNSSDRHWSDIYPTRSRRNVSDPCRFDFYASAFRRRRHYVFGLSVCPSVRPKPEIPSFDLYMGPLVHPTNRNRFTACPSVRPSGEVSGHLPENAWREWLKFYMLMYLDHLQNWLVYGHDFSNFGTILT